MNGKKISIFKINVDKKIDHLEKINIFLKTKEFNSRWENIFIKIEKPNSQIENKINKIFLTFENKYNFLPNDIIYSRDNCFYTK